ncbi:hypothetical protein R69927_03270 [Paraburkholderia domus]|uniref:TubC N-terminal docking domain-containing protein n=1 Tax=Paraburkholderia domus TaxID=2793075 RepID=A0A9N8MMR8_9BURK|nr:hypothetical protein [Paraburkholderia domus]MBK5059056.1 hypothetical protein [Burkholderia sp. R-70199]MBK5086071.1 hypothetical protein [Burkholderia sp. R-69927]MBK5119098.1 hypothetical protein [Burkholderia sp. R-69980]MBK5163141.1 hypothetical protein [Burkholderia sp. R-70211]MBK5178934.1 hypothetical protein [Burkholderia sp. R-69749]MCI0145217.1 hypothetical protein [Paraburkholderia sediminicola]
MSAADIVERAAALGVVLRLEDERIGIEGPARGVATIKPELAARKPEVMAYLLEQRQDVKTPAAGNPPAGEAANDPPAAPDGFAGALVDPDGGAYLPWGPYLSPADVQRMRGVLFDMIDELCRFEGWSDERRHDTMTRALRGPLSDLWPNIEYFGGKVRECRAEAEARALLAARSWRYEGR